MPSVAADGIAAVLEAQGSAVDARDVVRLRKGQFFMPGLVDTHTVSRPAAELALRRTSLAARADRVPPVRVRSTPLSTPTSARAASTRCAALFLRPSSPDRLTRLLACPPQLLDWLNNVTFPREAKFADVDYARRIYPAVVRRTLGLGVSRRALPFPSF